MAGFEYWETMAGAYHLVDKPHDERPMSFTVIARSAPLLRFLSRPEVEIEGEVFAPGLAKHRHLRGKIGMNLRSTGTFTYEFGFVGDDDKPYVFEGNASVSVRAPLETMTLLPGSIRDEFGSEVAVALLRFDARMDLFKLLKSFRLTTI